MITRLLAVFFDPSTMTQDVPIFDKFVVDFLVNLAKVASSSIRARKGIFPLKSRLLLTFKVDIFLFPATLIPEMEGQPAGDWARKRLAQARKAVLAVRFHIYLSRNLRLFNTSCCY